MKRYLLQEHIAPLSVFCIIFLLTPFSLNAQKKAFIKWEKTYGGSKEDELSCISLNGNGNGLVMGGETYSNDSGLTVHAGSNDMWIVATDDTGKLLWQKTLGGSSGDGAASVYSTTDGYIIAGSTNSNDGDILSRPGGFNDAWVVKLSFSGNLIWQKLMVAQE